MTISLRLNEADSELLKNYAKMKMMTVSEVIRQAVMRQIEDEYDLQVYERALEEYRKRPVVHSLDDVEQDLGLL